MSRVWLHMISYYCDECDEQAPRHKDPVTGLWYHDNGVPPRYTVCADQVENPQDCRCYGPFSRSHNPKRGCTVHSVRKAFGDS